MKNIAFKISTLIVAVLFVGGLTVAPVYAASEHGDTAKCGEGKCSGEKMKHKVVATPTPEAKTGEHKAAGEAKCGAGKCSGTKK